MIKKVVCGFLAFILVSCTQVNSTGEKTITQGDDTVAEIEISTSKMDLVEELSEIDEPTESKLLFKASGTEPGWIADIYNDKLRLILDYGKDSLIITDKFEGLDNKDGYLFAKGENDPKKSVSIRIINKSCVAVGSGDKMDRQITVIYKGKKYTGCGSFVK